jgi:hypothetical protein
MSHRATGGGVGPKMQSQRPRRKPPTPKTQQTKPKGRDKHGKPYRPMEIPVPKRADVEDALDRLNRAKPDEH